MPKHAQSLSFSVRNLHVIFIFDFYRFYHICPQKANAFATFAQSHYAMRLLTCPLIGICILLFLIRCLILSSYIGVATSTRRRVLRVIKSAEAIYILSLSGVPKIYILECSRKRPTILLICMFSVSPGISASRQHIPLTISSTLTPAFDASTCLM
jgi:hypothetical protein